MVGGNFGLPTNPPAKMPAASRILNRIMLWNWVSVDFDSSGATSTIDASSEEASFSVQ
ncbi:hypothetical protein Ancab_019925, partial [Ancistrocladus abbreviatus]